MRLLNLVFLALALNFFALHLSAQSVKQTLRGTVLDQVSQQPLAFVNVILSDSMVVSTDDNGEFRFDEIAIGNYELTFQFIGYEDIVQRNLLVIAGKEKVLNVLMQESVEKLDEVVVTASKEKAKPLNEMSLISTRMVSLDETQRYAASFNDPARMANSFAGVVQTDAGSNHIAIRGNSPNGLLWRLEGIDIPNPNHYSYIGTSGGGVSILSGQLLANSDFLTGAFAAEYGNALSGVFDIKLRKGNNEKREFTFQAGALGIDAAAEGPISQGSKNSFLINYRYSTLGIISQLIDLGGVGVTKFQDLSYNFSFKNKKWGDITLFGLNGLSSQTYIDTSAQNDVDFVANTFVNGITHSKTVGVNTFLRSALVLSNTTNNVLVKELETGDEGVSYVSYDEKNRGNKIIFSSRIQHKINAKTSLKAGIIQSVQFYNILNKSKPSVSEPQEILFDADGSGASSQVFGQMQHKSSNKLTANLGLHAMYFWLNKTRSIEPRAALQYTPKPGHIFSIGYGLHSQLLPLQIYFVQRQENGTTVLPNKNLNLSKAHHFVGGYSYQPTPLLNFKTEVYYQSLFDIPQGVNPMDNYSLLNLEAGTPDIELESKGRGRNLGVELTIEKYLSKGLYFTFANSLYDSNYKNNDGKSLDTRYNGNFTSSFTGGKEFSISKKKNRTMAINVKTIYAGGLRMTPIDLGESIIQNKEVRDNSKSFGVQLANYFRSDLKFIIKRNHKRHTNSFVLEFQNFTNRKNAQGQFYNKRTQKIESYNHVGMIPNFSYKIEF